MPDPWHREHLIRDAIGRALHEVMAADPAVHLFGEGCDRKVHFDAPEIERDFPDRVHTLPICVPPDTMILGDNVPISEARTGMHAFGADGQLGAILATMKRSYAGELVSIRASHMLPITATHEHPVLVVQRESMRFNCGIFKPHHRRDPSPKWIPAGEIKRGDMLVIPRILTGATPDALDMTPFRKCGSTDKRGLTIFPLTPGTAWLLGLYVAEGSTNGAEEINFALHVKETGLENRIRSIALQSLGLKARTYLSKHVNGMSIRISSNTLVRALPIWCGRGARNKQIPDFILTAKKEIQAAFVKGLFAGDGGRQRRSRNTTVYLSTSSKKLALQVQLLLASLGTLIGISEKPPSTAHLRDEGRTIRAGARWWLQSSSPDTARIFGHRYHTRRRIVHYITTKFHVLVPVKATSRVPYVGDVYNIETGSNTYLVNNAIVHNCEDGNLGFAVGAALLGGVTPVVDIITADFLYRAMDSVANTAAKLNFVLAEGESPKTILIRAEFLTAGPTTGQRPEALLTHIPGLNVVVPSTPRDAYGLTHAALATPGVTVLFEDRMILDAKTAEADRGPLDDVVPLGKAAVRRQDPGAKVTIVTYGLMRQVVEEALAGWSRCPPLDLIDLRSLYPVDWETIFASVDGTFNLLVVEPDVQHGGIGAEIVATVAEYNDGARVQRLGGRRGTLPASPALHPFYMPTPEEIVDALA